jgi:hypothetical protein
MSNYVNNASEQRMVKHVNPFSRILQRPVRVRPNSGQGPAPVPRKPKRRKRTVVRMGDS